VPKFNEIKSLSKKVFENSRTNPADFKELLNELLTLTVAADGHKLNLSRKPKGDLGLIANRIADKPLLLNNGRFLKFLMKYTCGKGTPLTINYSCFQYQCDEDRYSKRFIFRYDYNIAPEDELHPVAHLQINGELSERNIVNKELEDIRFPIVRPSVESLLLLLIDGFGLKPNDKTGDWRKILDYSESAFREYQAKKLMYSKP